MKFVILFVVFYCIYSSATACTWHERRIQCSAIGKLRFAQAFAAAAAAPSHGCHTMAPKHWDLVGCDSPAGHRFTKICAPAQWSRILSSIMGLDAIPLSRKILFRWPLNIHFLFGTPQGRSLVRRELTHIRQQDGFTPYVFGHKYITQWCNYGCDRHRMPYEIEANKFTNDRCYHLTNSSRIKHE